MNTRVKLVRGRGREHRVGLLLAAISSTVVMVGGLGACGGLVASPGASGDGSESGAGGGASTHAALGTYVGRVDGSDAEIAIVHGDGGTTAYVCGGNLTFGSLTRWFKGNVDSEIHLRRDGWSLDGAFAIDATSSHAPSAGDDQGTDNTGSTGSTGSTSDAERTLWTGTLIAPDGTTSTWHAAGVAPGTLAGLYAADIDDGKAGVIVQTQGDELSIQGAWRKQKLNYVLQVIPVMPLDVESGGLLVMLPHPDGARQLRVDPVHATGL